MSERWRGERLEELSLREEQRARLQSILRFSRPDRDSTLKLATRVCVAASEEELRLLAPQATTETREVVAWAMAARDSSITSHRAKWTEFWNLQPPETEALLRSLGL